MKKRPAPTQHPEHAELLLVARTVQQRAYAPYSEFHVGAALLGKSGKIFTGVNVENRSYGLTVCAERNAVAHAVASGELDFVAIAIASDASPPAPPCGACREVLAEFAPKLPVTLLGAGGEVVSHSIDALLPTKFEFTPPHARKK